jgi:hypothetical protein
MGLPMSQPKGGGLMLFALTCAGLVACGGIYKNGYFVKDSLRYHVASLEESDWRRVGFAGNDLAWVHRNSPHVLAMNATCDEHGDPPLDVLTTHMLFGFTDRDLRDREAKTIDGREALFSHYLAKLDGVPVELELVVLKKNGCVHDFMYVSPEGHADEQRPAFERLLNEFTAERI